MRRPEFVLAIMGLIAIAAVAARLIASQIGMRCSAQQQIVIANLLMAGCR